MRRFHGKDYRDRTGLFQLTTFVEPFNIQFSQFLLRDDEPLLFHTGPRALFQEVQAAVSSLIDPKTLRWIGFSHFEADECATVPEWQQLAPHSETVCSAVGKMVSVDDCLALRPAKGMVDGEVLETGTSLIAVGRRWGTISKVHWRITYLIAL